MKDSLSTFSRLVSQNTPKLEHELALTTFLFPSPQKLSSIQEQMPELLDYEPQIYAEEGEPNSPADLDYLDIPDEHASLEVLENLGPRFSELAACVLNHNHRD